MILVDSSVRIDFFRGTITPQTENLDQLLGSRALGIGNLDLIAVLQGCKFQKGFNQARKLLARLEFIVLGGSDVAVQAAVNHRKLRSLGGTVRGTVDVVLATRCIVSGYPLLHRDRGCDAFERHLGWRCLGSNA